MPKITFVVSQPGVRNSIVLFYTCHDGRLKYYTGQQAANIEILDKGTAAVLSRIKRCISELEVDYKIKGSPLTRTIVKVSLDAILNKKTKPVVGNMFEQMRTIVEDMRAGRILTPGKKVYSPDTTKMMLVTISLLERFNPRLSISNTSIHSYHDFIIWMQGENYSTNTIGANLKNWKTLGRMVGGSEIFDSPAFKKIQEETFDIYLSEPEIGKMYSVKLNDRDSLARDWFVLNCYTGLRVSDLVLLSDRNYKGGMITIANEKTDERVVIPAHRFVKRILKKYKGFPPPITDVEINRCIKNVAKDAGIAGSVLFTITKGGRRKDEYLEKWQMVSCHTARRSFITNLRKNGVPDAIVMKLTGIKSPATLKKYDKLGSEEAAKIAAQHKFFK